MNDMKCPFCGEKLQQTFSFNPKQFWCSNYYDHKHPINLQGTKELWQELIRTRKALDVAKDGLKSAKKRFELINNSKFANLNNVLQIQSQCEISKIEKSLEQITALEQKDK